MSGFVARLIYRRTSVGSWVSIMQLESHALDEVAKVISTSHNPWFAIGRRCRASKSHCPAKGMVWIFRILALLFWDSLRRVPIDDGSIYRNTLSSRNYSTLVPRSEWY